jgi:hypothetical protein
MVGYATLLLFNSCVTEPQGFDDDSIRPSLPTEVCFNESAGRGDLLCLTQRLDNGKECLFALDTGATCLPSVAGVAAAGLFSVLWKASSFSGLGPSDHSNLPSCRS